LWPPIEDNPGATQNCKKMNEAVEMLFVEEGNLTSFVFISPSKRKPKRAMEADGTQIKKKRQATKTESFELSELEKDGHQVVPKTAENKSDSLYFLIIQSNVNTVHTSFQREI